MIQVTTVKVTYIIQYFSEGNKTGNHRTYSQMDRFFQNIQRRNQKGGRITKTVIKYAELVTL